jgi:hypothetical protein
VPLLADPVLSGQEFLKIIEIAGKPKTHTVDFEIEEDNTSRYIVKCFGSERSQFAVSNPIYFEAPGFQAPQSAQAQVELKVVAAGTGEPLNGSYEVIEMIGREPKVVSSGEIASGHAAFSVPATSRIRIRASGCEPAMKSIFIDTPALLNATLEIQPEGLLDWTTYENVRKTLRKTQFKFEMRSSA